MLNYTFNFNFIHLHNTLAICFKANFLLRTIKYNHIFSRVLMSLTWFTAWLLTDFLLGLKSPEIHILLEMPQHKSTQAFLAEIKRAQDRKLLRSMSSSSLLAPPPNCCQHLFSPCI